MPILDLNAVPAREIIPGFRGKFAHSAGVTLAYWEVAEGTVLPEHDHPHEQLVNVIEGRFELTIDGQCHLLQPGHVAIIPPHARHSGRARTDCRIIDVFHPVRADYLNPDANQRPIIAGSPR